MIPKTFISKLLLKANIELIVGEYVMLTPDGAQLRGVCPFCSKRTFNVSVDKEIFKCFKCGKGGDVLKFVQEIEGVLFPEAVGILAGKIGMEMPEAEA